MHEKGFAMLLFDALSPAPRTLRMFLLEKNLQIPSVQVDVFAGENRQAPYLQRNPAGQTPALQLDDGQVLAESVAIMEYVEAMPHIFRKVGIFNGRIHGSIRKTCLSRSLF